MIPMEAIFTPVDYIPPNKRKPKYLKICETFLLGENKLVKVTILGTSTNSLYFGLRRIIRENRFSISLSVRAKEVYLEKIMGSSPS